MHPTVDLAPSPFHFAAVLPPSFCNRITCFGLLFGFATLLFAATTDALSEAEALFAQRRYAEAQPLFEQTLATDPRNTRALLHLGKLAAKRGQSALAVDYLKQASEIAPHDAELLFEFGSASCLHAGSLGTSFKALGAVRRGRAAMTAAVAMDPTNLMFRQGLLEFYANAPGLVGGSLTKAHEQAEAIAALDPNQGAFAHASLYATEGNYGAAMDSLSSILDRAPDNYFALYQYGCYAAESGQNLERGLSWLKRCLELPVPDKAPPSYNVWWRIGQINARLGQIPAARAALEKAQELAPHEKRITQEIAALPST